jgi:hypothetical protein
LLSQTDLRTLPEAHGSSQRRFHPKNDSIKEEPGLNAADLNEADPIAADVNANSHFAPLPAGPGKDSLDRRLSGGNETVALAGFEHETLEVAKATIPEELDLPDHAFAMIRLGQDPGIRVG